MNIPEQFKKPILNELNQTNDVLQKIIGDTSNDIQSFTQPLMQTFRELPYACLLFHAAKSAGTITNNHIKAAGAAEIIALGINRKNHKTDNLLFKEINSLLIIKGLQSLSEINHTRILQHATCALELAIEGRIAHLKTSFPTLPEYETIIQRKTASWFGFVTATGACLSGTSETDIHTWEDIGNNIGCAVHIMHDVYSLRNASDVSLCEAAYPLICYVDSLDAESRKNLCENLASSPTLNQEIRNAVCNSTVIIDVREKAEYFIETALIFLRKVSNQNQHALFSTFLNAVRSELYF